MHQPDHGNHGQGVPIEGPGGLKEEKQAEHGNKHLVINESSGVHLEEPGDERDHGKKKSARQGEADPGQVGSGVFGQGGKDQDQQPEQGYQQNRN